MKLAASLVALRPYVAVWLEGVGDAAGRFQGY
jgi:hypothetical protein